MYPLSALGVHDAIVAIPTAARKATIVRYDAVAACDNAGALDLHG